MTNYKRARDLAAEKFGYDLNAPDDDGLLAFQDGADFATRYWLTESEEIKLVKSALEDIVGNYCHGNEGCPFQLQHEALEAYTNLIKQLEGGTNECFLLQP
jgi:hypothetical protein